MEIDQIREQISEGLSNDIFLWDDILQETNPANYGYEVDTANVDIRDIWVDVPKRTFTFKNLTLYFSVRLGASNDRDGFDENHDAVLSGSGTFDFVKGGQRIEVKQVNVENDSIDLYE